MTEPVGTLTDTALVRAAQAGDTVGLGTLLERHRSRLHAIAVSILGHGPQAEDVVQNTWLALVQSASGITDPQGVLKWLLTTTRREAWAVSKRSRREDVRDDMGDAMPDVATTSDEPAEAVVRSAEQGLLWRHYKDLPVRCQQLLRVIAIAERPDYAQVADALGMPVGSIGPTRGRCLAKLRTALLGDPGWATS